METVRKAFMSKLDSSTPLDYNRFRSSGIQAPDRGPESLRYAFFSGKVKLDMKTDSAYIKCRSCGALNHVPSRRLMDRPLCGKCKSFLEFPIRPVNATEESFGREVFEWTGVVIVEFWSPRCGACALIQPLLERLAYQKAGLVKVVKVDIERELSLANRFQIRSTPSLLVYRNGKLMDELYGAYPEPQMKEWIETTINK